MALHVLGADESESAQRRVAGALAARGIGDIERTILALRAAGRSASSTG